MTGYIDWLALFTNWQKWRKEIVSYVKCLLSLTNITFYIIYDMKEHFYFHSLDLDEESITLIFTKHYLFSQYFWKISMYLTMMNYQNLLSITAALWYISHFMHDLKDIISIILENLLVSKKRNKIEGVKGSSFA